MDRKVVEAWKKLPERTSFFRGMSAWLGFRRKEIEFDVAKRVAGRSKWSLFRLLRLAANAVTSYTTVPLHFITLLGAVMLFGAVVLGVQTLYMKLSGRAGSGFTTVILLQLIIGSAIMTSLGIIGLYLSKIYHEVKARPRYIVSEYIRVVRISDGHFVFAFMFRDRLAICSFVIPDLYRLHPGHMRKTDKAQSIYASYPGMVCYRGAGRNMAGLPGCLAFSNAGSLF